MYNRNKFLIFFFLFLFLFFTVYSVRKGIRQETISWYDNVGLFLIAPFQVSFRYIGEKILFTYYKYSFLLDAEEQLRFTNKTNMMLKHELNNLYELKYENTRLRLLLNFKKHASFDMIPAQVIAVDISPNFKSIRINRGKNHGVKLGEPVVNYEGVVGRIVKVFDKHSDVLLLIDNNFVIDTFVQRSRARGIIYGTNSTLVDLKYINRFEDVKKKDIVVSSGFDGVFPKGILVGEIVDIEVENTSISQKIMVKPFTSFKKLEEVFVIDNK